MNAWIGILIVLLGGVSAPVSVSKSVSSLESAPEAGLSVAGEGDGRLSELAEALESRHAATRRVAVRQLAGLRSSAAWELVLASLGDEEGEVADEAQWLLARGPLVERLLGRDGLRSRDAWVRLRSAEVLGRCAGPVDGWSLAKHMSRRDDALTAAVAWSLERQARVGAVVGDARKCAKQVARSVRFGGQAGAAALLCLEALDGAELSAELDRALRGRDVIVRAAAAEAALRRDGSKDWARIEELAEDEDAGVRRALVDALALRPDRRRALLCVERLGREEVPTIRARLLQHLRDWSGLLHRYDPRPWRMWATALSEDWDPGPRETSGGGRSKRRSVTAGEASLPGATTTFGGLSVRSDRVCVLVDFSGSIRTEVEEGVTRRDYVEMELERLLMALPKTARFNLIAFSSEPHAWRDELTRNRRGAPVEALEWFRRLNVHGQGDLFAAAQLALLDPDVDTLLVFTDGVPTGGRRWKLELMALLLEQECRFRGVSVDAVLVGASARTARCWAEISARTGGTMMELDLEVGTGGVRGGG